MLEATETNTCIETVCRVLGRKKACDISDAECLATVSELVKPGGWKSSQRALVRFANQDVENMIKICCWLWYISSAVFWYSVQGI